MEITQMPTQLDFPPILLYLIDEAQSNYIALQHHFQTTASNNLSTLND